MDISELQATVARNIESDEKPVTYVREMLKEIIGISRSLAFSPAMPGVNVQLTRLLVFLTVLCIMFGYKLDDLATTAVHLLKEKE